MERCELSEPGDSVGVEWVVRGNNGDVSHHGLCNEDAIEFIRMVVGEGLGSPDCGPLQRNNFEPFLSE